MWAAAVTDRAVRTIGHERTVGSAWGGVGSFRDLLLKGLPEAIRLNEQPPYFVFDTSRQIAHDAEPQARPAEARPAEARPAARGAMSCKLLPAQGARRLPGWKMVSDEQYPRSVVRDRD